MKSSRNSSGGRLFDKKKPASLNKKKSVKSARNKPDFISKGQTEAAKKNLYASREERSLVKKKKSVVLAKNKPTLKSTGKSEENPSRTYRTFSKEHKPAFDSKKPFKPGLKRVVEAPKSKISKLVLKKVDTDIRLNKYISNAGVCSRREADNLIKSGNVSVNGEIITVMGYKVQLNDNVKFDGVSLNPETKRYVLLNKPKGFITSMDDEKGRKTVTDLIKTACKERIYPVGRLDRNTTGVLLFTNDGEMAKKLTHPKLNVHKLYHVTLDKNLKIADFQKIAEGFKLEDFEVKVDEISYIEGESKNEIGVKIHSGRNRIVRRIFEHFEYDVIKLDRVVFAGLTKKNLPRGIWRHLTEQEVINLKMI